MRKPIWAGTCAAIMAIASVAMSAQSNSTPQGRSEPTDRRVTVTGCLEAAPQSAPAAPAAEGKGDQAGVPKGFVLTHAAAASTDAPAADTAAARTFRLVASEAALSPHAGKKVELTGTVQDSDSSTRNSSASSSADASAPQLVVESGKVLAATCTQ